MSEGAANSHRGEVEIRLGGKAYRLRPSFAAIAEIEAATGQGLVTCARRLAQGDIRISDLAAIVTSGLRAAGEPARYDRVGEMILAEGLAEVTPAAVAFLRSALGGGAEEPA